MLLARLRRGAFILAACGLLIADGRAAGQGPLALLAETQQRPQPAVSTAATAKPVLDGYALLTEARTLLVKKPSPNARADQTVQAADLLRLAWRDPRVRPQAAQELWKLAETSRLQADEAQVARSIEDLGRRLGRLDTANFVVLYDGPIDWARAQSQTLERARHQYFQFTERLGLPVMPLDHKLVCILINDHDVFRGFAAGVDKVDARWVAGYYAPATNRVVFYNDSTSPSYKASIQKLDEARNEVNRARKELEIASRTGKPEQVAKIRDAIEEYERSIEGHRTRLARQSVSFGTAKTIHEAVHMLAFNSGLQRRDRDYPFWFNEGLATNFETDDTGGAFGPGKAKGGSSTDETWVKAYNDHLAKGRIVPLRHFITMTRVPSGTEEVDALYCQARVLFAYLYRSHRTALRDYALAVQDQTSGPMTAQQHAALFRKHFGPAEAIERKLGR